MWGCCVTQSCCEQFFSRKDTTLVAQPRCLQICNAFKYIIVYIFCQPVILMLHWKVVCRFFVINVVHCPADLYRRHGWSQIFASGKCFEFHRESGWKFSCAIPGEWCDNYFLCHQLVGCGLLWMSSIRVAGLHDNVTMCRCCVVRSKTCL